jgi:hypothetical protein
MACPFSKLALQARNIRLLSKNAGGRITLGVRLSMMPSYSGAKDLSINPISRTMRFPAGSAFARLFPV